MLHDYQLPWPTSNNYTVEQADVNEILIFRAKPDIKDELLEDLPNEMGEMFQAIKRLGKDEAPNYK